MARISIEAVVEPVKVSERDEYMQLLNSIIEAFKANPGKWVKLSIEGETPADKIKKVRSLRRMIKMLSKGEHSYGTIGIMAEERDGNLSVYAKPQEPRKKSAPRTKKHQSESQPQPQDTTQNQPT